MSNFNKENYLECLLFSLISVCFLTGAILGGYFGFSINSAHYIERIIAGIFFGFVGGVAGAAIGARTLKFFADDTEPPACPK